MALDSFLSLNIFSTDFYFIFSSISRATKKKLIWFLEKEEREIKVVRAILTTV